VGGTGVKGGRGESGLVFHLGVSDIPCSLEDKVIGGKKGWEVEGKNGTLHQAGFVLFHFSTITN